MRWLRNLITPADKRAKELVSTMCIGMRLPEADRLSGQKLGDYREECERRHTQMKDAAKSELETLGTYTLTAIVDLLRNHPTRGFAQGFLPTSEVVMVYTMPVASKVVGYGGEPEMSYVINALKDAQTSYWAMEVLSKAGEFQASGFRRKSGSVFPLSAEQTNGVLRMLLGEVGRKPIIIGLTAKQLIGQIARPANLDLLAEKLGFWDLKGIAGTWLSSAEFRENSVALEQIQKTLGQKLSDEERKQSALCGTCGFSWSLVSFEKWRYWYSCTTCHRTLCQKCIRAPNPGGHQFKCGACSGPVTQLVFSGPENRTLP